MIDNNNIDRNTDKNNAGLWYLLDWSDRDKCLLASASFGVLHLCYWLLFNGVVLATDFGRHYVSYPGFETSQWVFLLGALVWLGLSGWGAWLRHHKRESRLYVICFLYGFGMPLLALGHMIGLYNPVLGVMLLGSGLTGTILFDFRRIVGPFALTVALIAILAWLTINHYLEYEPLLRMDPVNKHYLSGTWILLMMTVSAPFVIGVFMVTWLLLARWQEREDIVRMLSNTDTLTGLSNRRALFMQLEHEMQRARRTGEPLAVAMMDLDHFKQVNDTWGHAVGDTVLKRMGELLPTLLRGVDLIGRVGGEEFVIVLPHTEAEPARQVIERCRLAIEACQVHLADGRTLNVTASFGLCCVPRMLADTTLQDVLGQADRALYKAKHRGRNRVEEA